MTQTSDARLLGLRNWLQNLPNSSYFDLSTLAPASSDASFRRYFRVSSNLRQHPTLIVMDAPPPHEDCRPFVAIAKLFEQAGVHVPHIVAENIEQGFLLLSDLGTETYDKQLNSHSAPSLYAQASQALLRIQGATQPGILPPYSAALLQQELSLFDTWFIQKHQEYVLTSTQQNELEQIYQTLIANNLSQAQVYVHRDYHCRNLMVTEHDSPGILDFQDAVYGPITYDLVSLWRDAYINWDEDLQLDWLARYWEQAKRQSLPVPLDFGEFYRDYEWMGLQRHLKVLGIFARLYHRDGKEGYLSYLPRVLTYTRQVAQRYREFKALVQLLDKLQGSTAHEGYTF